MVITLSSKGQLTLPKKIRQQLRLKTGDRLQLSINAEGNLELTPVLHSIKNLKGLLKAPSKPATLDDMEAAIMDEGGKLD